MKWPVAILAVLTLAACDQMRVQPRYDAFGRAALFADGKVNQPPPAGTLPQEQAAWMRDAARPPMSLALVERGRERYGIACVQCHGPAGDGDGVIPARGFPRPPAFTSPRLKSMTADHVVDVITNGYGVMFSQADRVAPRDRWAIAAYVQALQLSQTAPAALLSPEDRQQVEASHAG